MVSDDERREVAGRMRAVEASEFKDSPIVPFLIRTRASLLRYLLTLARIVQRVRCGC